ncbi:InlB B-repeat-containing protein, partial [Butyrivibrio sp. YAB3001]|uniref:InlB B-repeat-containing protein n=1 Tax=Butyrivibrio sp. YAB3001 TaxID=1520812 RepID=UPI001587FE01
MLRKWNRFLAIFLAFTLVTTTFNSNYASVRVYAENEEGSEQTEDPQEIAENNEGSEESGEATAVDEQQEEYSEEQQEPQDGQGDQENQQESQSDQEEQSEEGNYAEEVQENPMDGVQLFTQSEESAPEDLQDASQNTEDGQTDENAPAEDENPEGVGLLTNNEEDSNENQSDDQIVGGDTSEETSQEQEQQEVVEESAGEIKEDVEESKDGSESKEESEEKQEEEVQEKEKQQEEAQEEEKSDELQDENKQGEDKADVDSENKDEQTNIEDGKDGEEDNDATLDNSEEKEEDETEDSSKKKGKKKSKGEDEVEEDEEEVEEVEETEEPKPEAEEEKKTITIIYRAGEGGKVEPETNEVADGEEPEGSVATAFEGYAFVNWTQNGEEVSKDESFIPGVDQIENEIVFEANFEQVIEEETTEEIPEELVTITYTAGEGGSVDKDSETIDIADENAKFEGAKATAEEGFIFKNWTKDGEEVSTDELFVPDAMQVEDGTTFKANFESEYVKKLVSIKYRSTEGGSVTKDEEKIDLNSTEIVIEGSTAEADENYEFENWKDEAGNIVSEEKTLIPVTPEEDIIYTAYFKEVIKMPAKEFSGRAAGINVSVKAEEGTFPEGTEMIVTPVYDQEVLDIAANAVENETEGVVETVIAVDITFMYKGEEIQPEKPISVMFTSDAIAESEETNVVHIDDEGNADVIGSDVSGDTAEVSAESFSIYVIVTTNPESRRINVKFMNGQSEIASMLVKENDDMEQVLYDPGVGNIDENVSFRGWTQKQDYTPEDTFLTIDEVRAEISAMLPPDQDEVVVTYYAALIRQYTVSYLDTNDASLGQSSVELRADITGEQANIQYEVNMAYSPVDELHAFQGWKVKEGGDHIVSVAGQPYNSQSEVKIKNETLIVINGDVTFKVDAPQGNWLIFNENGKGGKYNAPQFVKTGEVTKKPCADTEMTRFGYVFGGWYEAEVYTEADGDPDKVGEPKKDENNNVILKPQQFVFGRTLSKNTTIYAKWSNNTTASYTVILWTQNLSRDGYDLKEAYVVPDGRVGQNIPYRIVDNGDEDYVKVGNNLNVDKKYTGFCAKEPEKREVKITPEGDAVLNIKFDRIKYNLKFYYYRDSGNGNNRYQCAHNSDRGENVWGIVTWHNATNTHPEQTYGPDQSETVGSYIGHYFVLSAYYGQDISNMWPRYEQITNPGGSDPVSFVMMNGTGLKPNATNNGSGTVKGIISVMDEKILGQTNNANGNFLIVRFSNYNQWNYHIWFETVPGEDYGNKPRKEYNGVEYYEDHVVTPRSSNTNVAEQNAPQYEGYTNTGRTNKEWTGNGSWDTTENGVRTYHINYIYRRTKSKVSFMDGLYADGNGNPIKYKNDNILFQSQEINQGDVIPENIKSYKPDLPSGEEGYVFEGWYTDTSFSTPYPFTSTMPIGGITVYAKWRQVEYRVFLHPNAGTDSTLDWGNYNQSMSFRIAYNGKVSAPTGRREGYIFVGWYLDEACKQVFNADAFRLNNATVTQEYDKTTHFTDDMDKWGNGATYNKDVDRFWIEKEFNIYAKWRLTLDGAEGINVAYSLVDPDVASEPVGTVPVDRNKYVDNAKAVAAAAVAAPEGYLFNGWVMQKWDSTANKYVDEGTLIYPGQEYTIHAAYAKVTDMEVPVSPDIDKVYVIQLRADYKEKEKATPTFIPWFKNDGSSAFHIDTAGAADYMNSTLQINEAVDIQAPIDPGDANGREKYTFKGWKKVVIGNNLNDAYSFMQNGAWTQNITTPDYRYENGKFYDGTSSTVVTKVAADEKMPYQALFAVWEKNEYTLDLEGYEGFYNGTSHSIKVVSDLPSGTVLSYSTDNVNWSSENPSFTDVIEQTVYVKAENANYFITGDESAVVKIKPIAVTITTGTDSKVYDGTALTCATAGITGIIASEVSQVTVTATGSQTEVGSSTNTYSINWGTAKASNYTISESLGTLTVSKNNAAVKLTAATASKTYDGTALTNSTVTPSGLPTGFTVEATASGSQTDVGSSANVVNDGYVIKDAQGNDKTANFTNVTKVNGTLTVSQAEVTITTGSDSKAYDGTALKCATAGITGLVASDDGKVTVTATGSQTEVGSSSNTYTIDWGTVKASNYKVTESLGTLTVSENSAAVNLTAATASKPYDGTALINSEVTPSGLPTGFTVEATASGSQTDVGSSANVVNDGYVIKDAQGNEKTANFTNVTKVNGTLTVSQAQVTITTGSDSKAYDGTPLKCATAGITGLVNGETAIVTATGSQTEVGDSSNTYSIDWGTTKASNYKVTENLGTLTVTKSEVQVILTAASDSKPYDGTPLTNDNVTATGLPTDFTVVATASGSQTDVGTGANVVNDGWVIKDGSGAVKTSNFTNVEKVNGKLTVNAIPVTITTGSDSKQYDGTALKCATAGITGLIAADTSKVLVTATGSQTEVGSSSNTYSISWGTAKASNYTISESLGTLTVSKNSAAVNLTAATASKTYDGTALTNSTVTPSGLPTGFTVEATASGSQTDVGSSANVVNDGYVIKDAQG